MMPGSEHAAAENKLRGKGWEDGGEWLVRCDDGEGYGVKVVKMV